MDTNNDIDSLYIIPKNVSTRFTFFPNFGWFELFIVLVGTAIGVVVFLLFSLFTKSFARIFAILLPVILCFFLVQADPRTGESMLSLLKNFKAYSTGQRLYLYVFGKGR